MLKPLPLNQNSNSLNILYKKSDRPLYVDEITERILRVKRVKGKTPGNSISAVLQYSKHAKSIAKGLYEYRE